ncbi:insulinase family protein [uncultured Sunxiuqinia sp.]|uniref:M16 family metallopeptidase n=1 Tax=uncultured Sunxiuqinia sp. TaxID=1573825 RepID=UPI002AA84937|nr:insulinase family protein [uncultured Sunxiuqinia sp.]
MRKLVIVIIASFAVHFLAIAQQGQNIPMDPEVRTGRLDNGLTYYIRHNELPEQRAEFYIAQRVGSILEEENQRGLAHFLEHMCFNGTKNFPGNTLIEQLESKGIKFGVNINAYTAIDETVYNLSNIPVTREGIIDTALLVLHDWSGFVSLNDKDIDQERGVIHEEWRTRHTADYRVMEKTYKNVFPDSRYAERMPIGLIEVIDNFPYQAIRDYYKKWYRPDLQAIIVVGDIDIDKVEEKIKILFADIPAPVAPAVRKYFEVPDNTDPIVSVVSDPELQQTGISISYKRDVCPVPQKNTTIYYSNMVLEYMVASMFNQRLYQVSEEPNPPFERASGGPGAFYSAKTKRAWKVNVSPRNNNDWEQALRTVLKENERMQRYGFTAMELERAKTNMLSRYESAYREREKQYNREYVQEYVRNFTDNEPSPGIGWEYKYVKDMLSNLTLDRVNMVAEALITDTNVVFAISGPENDNVTLPAKSDILAVWNKVKKADVKPYVEEELTTSLLEKKPIKGKITGTKQLSFGYTQWTLSNGVKVLIKATDYREDQVILSAYSPGGTSLVEDDDLPSAMVAGSLASLGGLGHLNQVDLGKILTGKRVSVSPFIGNLSEGIYGTASPKDFETLLQLTYLYFTQPRMDQDAFDTWESNTRVQLENVSLNPMISLRDTLNKILTGNNPRGRQFTPAMLDKVSYNKALSLYRERFSDAGDFTFFITGNVETDSIKEYVETYLGGLPSTMDKEKFIDRGIYPFKGIVKNHFGRQLETPKSSVSIIYTGEIPYTLKNIVLMDYVESVLNMVYTEKIREEKGGAYGVSVRGGIGKFPRERFSFRIEFDTAPSKRDTLVRIVYDEIRKILEEDPQDLDIQKVKEYMLKSYQEGLINNRYWVNIIGELIIKEVDVHSGYEEKVKSVTPSMVRKFATEIFSQGNVIEVSMNPKE